VVLYTNINQKLGNKLHGALHAYLMGTRYNYCIVITRQSNPPTVFQNSADRCNKLKSFWSMILCNINDPHPGSELFLTSFLFKASSATVH